ncbi:MAG: type VI secretion system baseplate subunit TssF [Burkholderiales bacterium]|nr:type VI secretion system baseplate subunit TssF [Burkholderiales bacterium]
MDPGLLRHYNEELAYLREMGAEFAQQFPKIAGRLGMDGLEVADPYVERLLEGFAFMSARVQLKLDAEYPRFIQHLLECVYPNALAPVPAMAVMQLWPDLADPALARGAPVPRGTALHAEQARGQNTRCEFRTAHALQLWPIEIVSTQYFSHAPDLPAAQIPAVRQARGGLRIRLRVHGGLRFSQLPLDQLAFYIAAPDDVAWRLHELMFGAALGTWLAPVSGAARPSSQGVGNLPPGASAGNGPATMTGAAFVPPAALWRGAESLRPLGYEDDEALLPVTLRGFSGHRLVQELAALPQRFLFVELGDLRARLARLASTEVELFVLFSRGDAGLEALVDASSLALNCTPAINLFPKRLDRIQTSSASWEYHVVPDRTRPIDYELHSLSTVVGHGTGRVAEQVFAPLYRATHDEGANHPAYYSLRREQRLPSARQQDHGARSSYIGSEVFISLTDPNNLPYAEDVRQLSLTGLVSNRDLPLLLPGAGHRDAQREAQRDGRASNGTTATTSPGGWTLDLPGPVRSVSCQRGPTPPRSRLPQGDIGWQLISQLTLNYLSIAGEDPQRAAAALRGLLIHHGAAQDANWRKQVEGLRSVRARQVTRRLPFAGPLAYGLGVAIDIEVDELAFQGASAFLMGAVLDRFLARQAAINSYTEVRLSSISRGAIMSWPPRVGSAALI